MSTHEHEHEWVHSSWRAVEDKRYRGERCVECGDRRDILVTPGNTPVPDDAKVVTSVEQLKQLLRERDSKLQAASENTSKLRESFRNLEKASRGFAESMNPEPEVSLNDPTVIYAMNAVFKHVEAVAADPSKTPEQLRELVGGLVSEFTNTLSAILRKADQ